MCKSKFSKEYFERYALNSLINHYDSNLSILEKSESPDYKSDKLDLGIEVVKAINNGEQTSLSNEILDKDIPSKDKLKEFKKKFKKDKGQQVKLLKDEYGNECIMFSDTTGLYDFNLIIDLIVKAINKKTYMLNNGYDKFKNNWLYIYSQSACLNKYDIESLMKKLNLSSPIFFDKIFINCTDRIFIIHIDVNESYIQTINLNESDLSFLKTISLEPIE